MPGRLTDKRIVIVEDDSFVRQGLATFLGPSNTVFTYETGEAALADEPNFPPVDVFVLDYKLPGKDGLELFRHFRPAFPAAKFILITGEMNYEMADETRKMGFDALILKPFDLAILEDNIAALLNSPESK